MLWNTCLLHTTYVLCVCSILPYWSLFRWFSISQFQTMLWWTSLCIFLFFMFLQGSLSIVLFWDHRHLWESNESYGSLPSQNVRIRIPHFDFFSPRFINVSRISSLDLLRICVYLKLRIHTLGLNPRYEFLIAFKIICINLSLIVRNSHMPPVSFNWVNSPVCVQIWRFGR